MSNYLEFGYCRARDFTPTGNNSNIKIDFFYMLMVWFIPPRTMWNWQINLRKNS